jgi:hypothetical protein
MKKSSFNKLLILLFTTISVQLSAQDYKIYFALLGSDEVPDSVQVTNIGQNTNLTLKGDDVLHLVNTSIHIYPNPIQQTTSVEFYNTKKGNVSISVIDIAGRKLVQNSRVLSEGNCVYKLSGLGMGTFIVNISTNNSRLSAKVISTGETSQQPTIEFLEVKKQANSFKSRSLNNANIVEMQYNEGERLKFTAYLKSMTSVQENIPTSDKSITFEFDDLYMMPYYTGKILPSPKNVEYKSEYRSLTNTAIILNNIESNDPRLKYLLDRITRYGGKYAFATQESAEYTCVIKINDDSLTPPQNPQGYVMKSSGKILSLKGTDFQGLLWAISSLNQMIFIKDGKTVVRTVDVVDWPDSELRGMLPDVTYDIKQLAHLMVAFKLNLVDFRATLSIDKEHGIDWRMPRSNIFYERLNEVKEQLTSLGFVWYAGARFLGYDQVPQINCSSDSDFNTIYNNFAVPIANAGGNLSVQFDDTRYPLHPDDINRFGTAAKADYYLITKLYQSLSSDYSDIRIAFTPPYYWGPVAPNPLPESRDDYLNFIGTLPQAFDIYWTGPSVISNTVLPEYVAWEADRIKRKPLVFQNAIGTPHANDYHYMTDPVYSLGNWYYTRYLNDIKAYMMNGGNIDKSSALVSIADWTWNQEKYNPEATIKDAIMKLTGVEAYPILKAMNAELSAFDPYKFELSFDAIRNAAILNETLGNLEILNTELKKINGNSVEFWTAVNSTHINRARHFVEQVNQALQDPIVQQIIDRPDASVTMYFAVKDGNFDPNSTDILIEPDNFSGCGVLNYGYTNSAEGIYLEDRPTAYITGQGTPISEMTTTFSLNQFPPTTNYQLIITGADDFLTEKCPIRITLNNVVIFEGPNTFLNTQWNTQASNISANSFDATNFLTITNISPNGNFDAPPAFLLNYVVLHEMP